MLNAHGMFVCNFLILVFNNMGDYSPSLYSTKKKKVRYYNIGVKNETKITRVSFVK